MGLYWFDIPGTTSNNLKNDNDKQESLVEQIQGAIETIIFTVT